MHKVKECGKPHPNARPSRGLRSRVYGENPLRHIVKGEPIPVLPKHTTIKCDKEEK